MKQAQDTDDQAGTQSETDNGVGISLQSRQSGLRGVLVGYRTEMAIAIAVVLVEVIVGLFVPQALTKGNVLDILQAAAPLIIMAFGQMLVVITGGIDLSVGSTFSLTGMIIGLAMTNGYGAAVSTAFGLGTGLVIGAVNGMLITLLGLTPFVVTLITYAIAASLAFTVTNGHSVVVDDPTYYLLNSGTLIPMLPNFVMYCVVLLFVIEFFLKRVVAGRWIYAIGSSAQAARLLGIPVQRLRFLVYVASGIFASFSSALSISYISNGESTAGSSMMLQAIAGVVIGGGSLSGGTGSAVGALFGALMIVTIQNGVNLIGINSFWQGSVTGLVILVAVLVDRFSKARR
jgi:ribose transport system permease protein